MSGLLLALTLPGLVLLLLAAGIVEQVAARAHRRVAGRPARRGSLAGGAIDVLQAALYPEKRHELDERHSQQLRRDDEDDGAPPHSTVDLEAGVARLRVATHGRRL